MPTSDTPVHPLIQERYQGFEGAVGAIDGTHIPIRVPALFADENRNRKGVITTNVLAICDFNFKFIYLLPGFSGSAHDSRVFREAKLHFGLTCPAGRYYLGDLGYPNCDAVLTPYRGVLYHTEAWRRTGRRYVYILDLSNIILSTDKKWSFVREPSNKQELFNRKHASLRNYIERIFGVLKRRFKILASDIEYPMPTQPKIFAACTVLHNMLQDLRGGERAREVDPDDLDAVEGVDEDDSNREMAQEGDGAT